MASSSGLIGNAGEHYAAAELNRRGFLVTLTRGNAPGVDILAYHPDTKRTVAIQVKTSRKAGDWMLNAKDENEEAVRSDFFVLVFLSIETSVPVEFNIVPSESVAKQIHESHQNWLSAPGTKGQKHDVNNTIRHFLDKEGRWKNKWGLILAKAGVGGTEVQTDRTVE